MITRSVLIVIALLSTGAPASGERGDARTADIMTRAEIEDTLMGVELVGTLEGTGSPWSECIDPEGNTVFRFGGEARPGRLTVTDDDLACFAYGAVASCFSVVRAGEHFALDDGAPHRFLVTRVEGPVSSCRLQGPTS